jgi:hypothetical protein
VRAKSKRLPIFSSDLMLKNHPLLGTGLSLTGHHQPLASRAPRVYL